MVDMMRVHREGVTNGVRWQIVSDCGVSGVRWRVEEPSDHLGGMRWQMSPGAFYDDAPDHPEGAIEWATRAVLKYLRRHFGEEEGK
jgi:hypothetical protein